MHDCNAIGHGSKTRVAEPALTARAARRSGGRGQDGAAMPERAGQGLILCADRKPVRCTYVWGTRERDDGPAIVGTLRATAAALRAVWLVPTVSLRLSTGDRLTISVTDLSGGAARFESVPGPQTRARDTRRREGPRTAAR